MQVVAKMSAGLRRETALLIAQNRVAKVGENMPGTGKCNDAKADLAIIVLFDQEAFFAVNGVLRKRAVGKTKLSGFGMYIDDVDDFAWVK